MTTTEILTAGIEKVKGEIQWHVDTGVGEDFSLILERFSQNFEDRSAGLPNNNLYEEHINHSNVTFLASHVSSSDEAFFSTERYERYYEERERFVSPDSRGVWKGGEDITSGGVLPDVVSDAKESQENACSTHSEASGAGRNTDENIVNDSVRKGKFLSGRVTDEINQESRKRGEMSSGSTKINTRDLTSRETSIKEVNAKVKPAGRFQIKEDEITRALEGGRARGIKSGSKGASAVEGERLGKEPSHLRPGVSMLSKKFTIIKRSEGAAEGIQGVNNKNINKNGNKRVKLSDRDEDRGIVYKYLKGRGTAGYIRAGRISRYDDVKAGLLEQNRSGDEVATGLRNHNFIKESLLQKNGLDLFSESSTRRFYRNGFQDEIGNTLWKYESSSHIVQSKTDYQLLKNADWNFNDVVRQFTILLNKGWGEARIVLQPESLGSMKLSIRVENNEVSTSIVVENQVVRDLIASKLPVLESSLEEHGFFLGSFEVGVRDDEHEGNALPDEARRGLSLAEKVETPLKVSSSEANGTVPGLPWLSAFVNITV